MAPSGEQTVAVLAILGICGLAIYRFILWVMDAPRTLDPWGEETEEAVNREEALPLCHHCFTPQEHNGWFCPECGATVGPCCNYLPAVYIFSIGGVLRAGVTERLRRTPLIIIGFVLTPLLVGFVLSPVAAFVLAAPIYWVLLLENLRRSEDARRDIPPVIV